MTTFPNDWDYFWLELAEFVAIKRSKDPSTKVGAVIARDKEFISFGYNGFPAGVADTPERYANRPLKYQLVVHAEQNAVLKVGNKDARGATMYLWPFGSPCVECAKDIIQAGITRVVYPESNIETFSGWRETLELAKTMFSEAGVELREVPWPRPS